MIHFFKHIWREPNNTILRIWFTITYLQIDFPLTRHHNQRSPDLLYFHIRNVVRLFVWNVHLEPNMINWNAPALCAVWRPSVANSPVVLVLYLSCSSLAVSIFNLRNVLWKWFVLLQFVYSDVALTTTSLGSVACKNEK